ncbi:MAG: hypothetical protein ABJM06_00635 [Gilvibacter sp.]
MNTSTISITSDQRYYHMIVLKSEDSIDVSTLAQTFGDWTFVKSNEVFSVDILHFIYSSESAIHRGNQEIYETKNNLDKGSISGRKKPFAYDCLIVNFRELGITCLLAPFSDLIDAFQSAFIAKFQNKFKFFLLNIYDVIKTILDNELVSENLTLKTTGVGISKISSDDISNITIKGNKPLSTEIGELVFGLLSSGKNVKKTPWTPSACRFKSVIGRKDNLSRINLSLNTDKYGNYKMYLQKHCINILSLIFFINYITKSNHYLTTTISPTKRRTSDIL